MAYLKSVFLLFFVIATLTTTVYGQDKGPKGGSPIQSGKQTITVQSLSARGAQDMADAMVKHAILRQQTITIAIVDAGGNLLYFKRMDGAGLGTINAAIGKAKAALSLQAPTQVFSDLAKQDLGLAVGFLSTDLMILGGGQPIRIADVVVGGVAVSGGAGGEDDLYNNVGLKAVGAQ